jgi:hypothetical protein
MFSARGVALNVTTASVQLRVLHNSVYLSARLKLRGTNYTNVSEQLAAFIFRIKILFYPENGERRFLQNYIATDSR